MPDDHTITSLIEGQATIATELVHLKEEIQEVKIILRGTNGVSGIVGWWNQRKGEIKATSRVWGFVAGIVGSIIAFGARMLLFK